MAGAPHRFGCFELRPAQRQLLADGQPAALGARAFDLLLALVERRERVVPKTELLDLVWPGVVVEENNLQVQVSSLRKLLGADAIATIPGRGYRFTVASDADAPAVAGASVDVQACATNLPAEPDALIGRDAELGALREQLPAHRLLSIVGPGGIGKTRLARALARDQRAAFADGAWWVDLQALTAADRIAPSIAQAVLLSLPDGDAAAQLARALGQRRLLLVRDNCEHLADAVAALLAGLLGAAPGLHVLVTSQLPLHLPGEQVWRLDGLALPALAAPLAEARRSAALALFEQRAHAADQRFSLDHATLAPAIELCRQLDGNALAIEMAAARVAQFGVMALQQRLAERLRLLRSGSVAPMPSQPARQHSLRATLDWSCALLSDAERTVLRRLGVFVGTFRLELAQQVAADDGGALDEWVVLDAIGALVERSLLRLQAGEPPRYRLLETMRLYAAEELDAAGERARIEQRHGKALARLAERSGDEWYWASQRTLVEKYAADYDDLAVAFERACQRGDAAVATGTADLLGNLDWSRGDNSARRGRMAATHSLLPTTGDARLRARLWNQAAPLASIALPDVPRLAAAAGRVAAWRAVGEPQELYDALADLAAEHARVGDFAAAHECERQALALEGPSWPPRLRSVGARIGAEIGTCSGDHEATRRAFRRQLELAEEAGDADRAIVARGCLANVALAAGDDVEAVRLLREAVDEERRLELSNQRGMSLMNLAAALLMTGDDAGARDASARALPEMASTPPLRSSPASRRAGLRRPDAVGRITATLAARASMQTSRQSGSSATRRVPVATNVRSWTRSEWDPGPAVRQLAATSDGSSGSRRADRSGGE